MLRLILILILLFIVYNIYLLKTSGCNGNEKFINIANPFVSGLSQFGSNKPDKSQMLVDLDPDIDLDYSDTDYTINPNNMLNRKDQINHIVNSIKSNKINNDIDIISSLRQQKQNQNQKQKLKSCIKTNKLNKFFNASQFNDAYRDIMTVINIICPDQKILFNLQSLPVITTLYDCNKRLPTSILKLVNQFIIKLNEANSTLPESSDILNNYNNYLPLTTDLKKYVQNKGVNKFYKDIGVDFNLYADTPPNSPVELVKIIEARREYTEYETKYIISFVIKKVLKSVSDQMKITVHFVLKNNPLEGENLFDKTQFPKITQQIAIEFVFTDGFYTNDYNADYECSGNQETKTKKVSMSDGADNFYSFNSLGENTMLNSNEIITELNKKYREHEIEMSNFNVNIPYPIYQNPTSAKEQSKNNIF